MEKNLDSKGRWRNKIVAFRVSPEEAEQIDASVRLSGLSKQDYITKRLTDRSYSSRILDTIRDYKDWNT